MKKIYAILLMFIFSIGMVVIPTVHRVHCHDSEHSANTCKICMVSAMSLDVATISVSAAPSETLIENAVTSQ